MAGANRLAVNDEDREAYRVRDARRTGAALFLMFGGAFVLAGLVNLGFVWIPPDFASTSWKFAALTRTLEHLPLTVLGSGLLAYGAVRHRDVGAGWVRVLATVLLVMALAVLGAGLLHTLAAPAVLQGGADVAGSSADLVARSALETACYVIVLGAAGVTLRRCIEPA